MAIAYLHRPKTGPVAHRIERRNPKRTFRANARQVMRTAAWTFGLLMLTWLVVAGFYGLLVNA